MHAKHHISNNPWVPYNYVNGVATMHTVAVCGNVLTSTEPLETSELSWIRGHHDKYVCNVCYDLATEKFGGDYAKTYGYVKMYQSKGSSFIGAHKPTPTVETLEVQLRLATEHNDRLQRDVNELEKQLAQLQREKSAMFAEYTKHSAVASAPSPKRTNFRGVDAKQPTLTDED